MSYTSLHNYLDIHLGKTPSHDDIKQCKRAYWKWYRTEHRKKRIANAKALNLTIPKSVWNNLKHKAKESGIDVYDYIKRKLASSVEASTEMNIRLSREMMQSYQLLLDCIDGDIPLQSVIDYVEKIILRT